jgi:hypothetical protein
VATLEAAAQTYNTRLSLGLNNSQVAPISRIT